MINEWEDIQGILGTTDDNERERAMVFAAAVQDLMEIFCGRKFDRDTYTETVKGTGTPRLWVSNWPLISVTSLSFFGTDVTASFNMDIDEDEGLIQLSSGYFPRQSRAVRMTYIGGYSHDLDPYTAEDHRYPKALKLVHAQMMKKIIDMTQRNSTGKQSENFGYYSYTNATAEEVTKMFENQLNQFKRIQL